MHCKGQHVEVSACDIHSSNHPNLFYQNKVHIESIA